MVESFKLREEDAVRVDGASLRSSTAAMIAKMGVPPADAELAADVLVTADLRGVDSHGVSNELRVYLERYADGTQNPRPDWMIERERASAATIDADGALGVIIGPKAMEIAITKARDTGVGVVTIWNSGCQRLVVSRG